MRVIMGTRSIPKVTAITRAFSRYSEIWMKDNESIEYVMIPKETRTEEKKSGIDTDKLSGVKTNPMTLEETILGAKNRAKAAFDYGEATRHLQLWSRN